MNAIGRCYGVATHSKNVFESRLKQVSELFLRDEFKERGFERVRANVIEEFHGRKQVAPSHYHALTPTPMFSGIHEMAPTDAELATQALAEEGNYRFPAFDAADAVTLVSFTRASSGDVLNYAPARAFPSESASGHHSGMQKEKEWSFPSKQSPDTLSLHVRSEIWDTPVA